MIDVSNKEKMVLNTNFTDYRIAKFRWFDRGVGDRAPLAYHAYVTVSYSKEWRDTYGNTVPAGIRSEIMVHGNGFKLKREAIEGIENHKNKILANKKKAGGALLAK